MKFNVIAMAGALLALTAAAAQASPATVIPDTVHHIGSGAKQIVSGTGKGISDQYHHDVAAGRRTVHDARHGRLLHHHHRYHHRSYYHHHYSTTCTARWKPTRRPRRPPPRPSRRARSIARREPSSFARL